MVPEDLMLSCSPTYCVVLTILDRRRQISLLLNVGSFKFIVDRLFGPFTWGIGLDFTRVSHEMQAAIY